MRVVDKVIELSHIHAKIPGKQTTAYISSRMFKNASYIKGIRVTPHNDIPPERLVITIICGRTLCKHLKDTGYYLLDADYECDLAFYESLWDVAREYYEVPEDVVFPMFDMIDPANVYDIKLDLSKKFHEIADELGIGYTKFIRELGYHANMIGTIETNYKYAAVYGGELIDSQLYLLQFIFRFAKYQKREINPETKRKVLEDAWIRFLYISKKDIKKCLIRGMKTKI